ncbi:MAG: TIGR04282 family arsenosugar biosynthesis glycosyltransferase [Chthoniobacterales bacterium]
MLSSIAPRRAVLIFADAAGRDRVRRGFPTACLPLLAVPNADDAAADVHLFTRGRAPNETKNVHRQSGADFSERFENAIETLASLGYAEVVAVGRDCPALAAEDIARAFAELQNQRLVLGPDHRGGCYLIAFRSADAALLRGIRWLKNTDCAQLRARCGPSEVFLLPTKHDLDSWADVRLLARAGEIGGRLAALLGDLLQLAPRYLRPFVDLSAQAVRVRGQMPPPSFLAA